jgi:hypothetical protein
LAPKRSGVSLAGNTGMAGSWGADDRWGDYDLLFGAAKLHSD